MADTLGEAFVALRSDDSRLQSDIETQLTKALGPAVAKGAKILGGLFLGKQVVGVARAGIAELAEAGKQTALLGSQLRATGGAAGITAAHVKELAQANLDLAGTDDEVTLASARILLQFNRITATGGIFDETLASAQDLAIALGQDLPVATRTLGLALQDPLRATRLLRSENVALTVAQQEQIKQFVQSGNILGAQRIILDQVKASVGGLAGEFGDTLGGDLQRAQEELENTKASMLEGTAPALRIVADATSLLSQEIQGLPGPLRTVASVTLLAGSAFVSLAPAIGSAISGFRALRPATQGVGDSALFSASAVGQLGVANRELSTGVGGTTSKLGGFARSAAAAGGAVALATAAWAIWEQSINDVNTAIDKTGSAVDARLGAAGFDKLVGGIQETQAAIDELRADKAGSSAPWDADFRSELGHGIDQLEELKSKYNDQIAAARELAASTGLSEDAALKQVRATQLQTGAAEDAALAEQALADVQSQRLTVITGSVSAQRAYAQSLRGVSGAQQSLADAQRALNEALRGASAEDRAKAEISLREAQIGQAAAAKNVATEEATLARLRSGMSGTVEELTDQEQRLADARAAADRAQRSLAELEREARINARRGIAQTREQRLAIADAARAAQDAAKNTAAEEAKLRELRSPASIAAVTEQELKLEQARLAQQTAAFAVTDAESALQAVQAQGTAQDQAVIDGRQRVADAQGQVTDAYLSQIDAAAALADANNLLAGKEETARSKAVNLRTALSQLLSQFAPGSPERRNLEDEIALLDQLLAGASAIASGLGGGFVSGGLSGKSLIHGASGFAGTVDRATNFQFGEGHGAEDVLAVPHSKGGIQLGSQVTVSVGGVHFHGVVPSAAEAFRTGQAVGAGISDVLTARDVRLARKIA